MPLRRQLVQRGVSKALTECVAFVVTADQLFQEMAARLQKLPTSPGVDNTIIIFYRYQKKIIIVASHSGIEPTHSWTRAGGIEYRALCEFAFLLVASVLPGPRWAIFG